MKKKKITKVGINIKDLIDDVNEDMELQKKLLRSPNFAKTFCWFAIKFIDHSKSHILVSDLAKFLKKDSGYCYKILETFSLLGVVKALKSSKNVATKYVPTNLDIFNHYLDIAKKTLGLDKKRGSL